MGKPSKILNWRFLRSHQGISLLETIVAVSISFILLWLAGQTVVTLVKLNDAAAHAVMIQKTIVTLTKFVQLDETAAMVNQPDPDLRDALHPCNKLTTLMNVPEAASGPFPQTLFRFDAANPQALLLGTAPLIAVGTQQGNAESIEFIQIGARLSHFPAYIPTMVRIRSAAINSLAIVREYEIPIIMELNTTVTPAVTRKCESQRYSLEPQQACRSMNMVWDAANELCDF